MEKWISVLFGTITLDMEIDNVNRLENFFEINIPLFSRHGGMRQNCRTPINIHNFNKLQKLRDVNESEIRSFAPIGILDK